MSQECISFGVLTVSDSCARYEKEDISGKILSKTIKEVFLNAIILKQQIVPDEKCEIINILKQWVDEGCDIILTIGGTGFSPRDVTPEATKEIIEKEAPGISYAIVARSLSVTPMAMLSRAVCGIKHKSLIINLPGSCKGAVECFTIIKDVLPHAVALLQDNITKVAHDHTIIQNNEITPSKIKLSKIASRNRISIYPMIEVTEAIKIILKEIKFDKNFQLISIQNSLHRVLFEDIYSKEPLPPFDASMKDGYAVLAEDGVEPRIIRNFSAAGDAPSNIQLKPGEAVRISTGAAIPKGANAIVQVEDTTLLRTDGEEELEIEIQKKPVIGQDIRKIGSDINSNVKVLEKCECILGAHIGVMASVGVTQVKVFTRPSVGVISSGNELIGPEEPLQPGKIRDSNKLTIINLLKQFHYISNDCGIAKDNPNSLKYILQKAFEDNDIIITTGGVSMGEFDLVKQVLIEDFGGCIHFGRVNMKPGKPTTFVTLQYKNKEKIVFALPGNPVSASVTCLLFVIPTLKYLENNKDWQFPILNVWYEEEIINNDCRFEYVRVNIYAGGETLKGSTTGNQISSRLNSMVGCNGLLILSPNSKIYKNFGKTILIGKIF